MLLNESSFMYPQTRQTATPETGYFRNSTYRCSMAKVSLAGLVRKATIAVVGASGSGMDACITTLAAAGYATTGCTPEDVARLKTERPAVVVLLGTCREAVFAARGADPSCQIVVVSDQLADRALYSELQVHGVCTGGLDLIPAADAAVRTWMLLCRLEEQRLGLLHIVDIAPRLSRLQPMDSLFQVALSEILPLVGGGDGFVATQNSGLFVFDRSTEGIVIRAGTGRFSNITRENELDDETRGAVQRGFFSDTPLAVEGQFVLIPVRTRDGERGCLVIEARVPSGDTEDLCRIYGQQVGQALENLTLWERATTDALTRLHNRAFGAQRLEEVRALDVRHDRCTSVLLIDIDRFKSVNDVYGHAAGDITLRAVASAVQGVSRRSDVVARWGGEELLMVLPDTRQDKALLAGERVRAAVAALSVPFSGAVIQVTVSIGSATAGQEDRRRMDAVLAEADSALYVAKNSGRNRVCDTSAPL